MASEWPVLSLREAGVALIDCEHRTPAAVADGYPYVAIPQMRNGRIDPLTARRISPEDYVTWTRKALPRDHDVVLSRRTNPGETAVAPLGLQYVLGQNLVILRADGARVYPPFLRWLVRSPDWWEQIGRFLNVGAVFDSLRCADIPNFRVRIPPLADQERISGLLGALDDKIELNRRMSGTLEATARALFKSWFVDFDPVRARSEGRDPGLPSDLAALFPDSLDDSEIGEIPAGWSAACLGDVSALNPEAWSVDSRPEVLRYVDLTNTKWGRIDSVTSLARETAPSRAQRVLRSGDTIVGTVRPGNGSYALVSESGLTGSTGFAVLRPLRPEYAPFVYMAATSPSNVETLSHLADGGAYPAVRPEVVAATPIARPTDAVLLEFSRVVVPMLERIAQAERESGTLTASRDTLLPRLISGELWVPDAERMVEAEL